MASLTQQPQLTPQPNIEPPGFSLLRDLLMRKLIGEEASPYGFSGSPDQANSLFTGNGRGTFNPYSGGYGGQQGGQQPTPGSMQLPGGGVFGQEPPNQMGGGGGQSPQLQAMMKILAPQGQAGQMPPPQQPQGGGGGGMYGFDGYTLNGQISRDGNFDGCRMGMDAMPGAPPMPGAGSQPGPGAMRPMARHPHQHPNPQHAAALRAIMMAIAAKRGGGMRPPMGGRPPMMGAAPAQGMASQPMGMDSPYHDQRGPMSPLGMDAAPYYPPGSDPNSSVSLMGGYANPTGWYPGGSQIPEGGNSATIAQTMGSGGAGGGLTAGGSGYGGGGGGMVRPMPRQVPMRGQGWSV